MPHMTEWRRPGPERGGVGVPIPLEPRDLANHPMMMKLAVLEPMSPVRFP